MSHSVELAARVRELFQGKAGFTEKAMFGGTCFLFSCPLFNRWFTVIMGSPTGVTFHPSNFILNHGNDSVVSVVFTFCTFGSDMITGDGLFV